jgi:hypothetical protein
MVWTYLVHPQGRILTLCRWTQIEDLQERKIRPIWAVIFKDENLQSSWFDRVVTVADLFFFARNDSSFPQTAPNYRYSFQYGDVSPCDSLPSLIFALLVICKIINGSSDYGGADRTPTPMPKSVQTNFLENICNLKSLENLLVFLNTWRRSLIYRLTVHSYKTVRVLGV